jgi:hypothetical protein
MPMDEKLCDDKEGKCGGDRAPPQHTMEPLMLSAEDPEADCAKAQVPTSKLERTSATCKHCSHSKTSGNPPDR